jgi:hypothetical protein
VVLGDITRMHTSKNTDTWTDCPKQVALSEQQAAAREGTRKKPLAVLTLREFCDKYDIHDEVGLLS